MVEYYVEEDCNGRLPDQWPQVFANPAFAAAPAEQAVAQDCSVAPYCEDRRYFKDFLVSCRAHEADGARFCSANAYVHNANAPAGFDYQLRVSRERRGAPLRVSLIAVDEFLNRSKPLQIKVDGEQVAFLNPDEIETYQAINDYFIGPQEVTDHVVEAMKAGSQVEFAYTGESGKRLNISFSLSGLTASLLWMQENTGN